MAKKRISDVLIEVLANAGIERIYGITGDSLNSVMIVYAAMVKLLLNMYDMKKQQPLLLVQKHP